MVRDHSIHKPPPERFITPLPSPLHESAVIHDSALLGKPARSHTSISAAADWQLAVNCKNTQGVHSKDLVSSNTTGLSARFADSAFKRKENYCPFSNSNGQVHLNPPALQKPSSGHSSQLRPGADHGPGGRQGPHPTKNESCPESQAQHISLKIPQYPRLRTALTLTLTLPLLSTQGSSVDSACPNDAAYLMISRFLNQIITFNSRQAHLPPRCPCTVAFKCLDWHRHCLL
jgi:hypothetical protein